MFDLDIAHIPGITNTAADALSRLVSPALCCPVIGSPTDDWKHAYKPHVLAQNISMLLEP